MTNERIADIILGVSTAGFIGTYFINSGLGGGLLHGAFGAAMVGGIADWFAIRALFHEIPLDTHSNLLFAKRDKLIEAMVDFSTKDVLDKESVKHEVYHRDIVALIIEYWENRNGRTKVNNVLQIALERILDDIDLQSVVKKLTPHIRQCIKEHSFLQNQLPLLLQKVTDNNTTVKFYVALLKLAKFIYNEPEFQEILKKDIHELVDKFLGTRVDRRLARLGGHLASNGLSDDDILGYLNEWANGQLTSAIESPVESYTAVKKEIHQLLDNRELWEELQKKKNEFLDQADLQNWIFANLNQLCTQRRDELFALIESLLDVGMEHIKKNPAPLNTYLQKKLAGAVEDNYDELPDMIRRTITDKGERYIVDMVHEKAGDNLQAIRISGSGIGAVAGTLLYLLSTIAKGVFG